MYRATKAGRGWVTAGVVHAIQGLPQILNLEQALVPTDRGIILLDTTVELGGQTYATIEALLVVLYGELDRESFTQSIEPILAVDLPAFSGSAVSDIRKEVPTGAIDGYNFMFSLINDPVPGSEAVWLNGLLQKAGDAHDYVISGKHIFFIEPPYEDSIVFCSYAFVRETEIRNETPLRLGDRTHRLQHTPVAEKELVYLNGMLQQSGPEGDYVLEDNRIIFAVDTVQTDRVMVNYFI